GRLPAAAFAVKVAAVTHHCLMASSASSNRQHWAIRCGGEHFSLDFFSPEQISGKVYHLTGESTIIRKVLSLCFQSLGMPRSLLISEKRHRGVNLLSVLSWIAVPTAGGA